MITKKLDISEEIIKAPVPNDALDNEIRKIAHDSGICYLLAKKQVLEKKNTLLRWVPVDAQVSQLQ